MLDTIEEPVLSISIRYMFGIFGACSVLIRYVFSVYLGDAGIDVLDTIEEPVGNTVIVFGMRSVFIRYVLGLRIQYMSGVYSEDAAIDVPDTIEEPSSISLKPSREKNRRHSSRIESTLCSTSGLFP